jgi:hypothetical protein
LSGIEKLFFDENYWLYFALIPENYVVCTSAIPFLHKQVSTKIGESLTDYVRSWISLTRALTRDFEIQFIPKMNFKVTTPIRAMVSEILQNPLAHEWQNIVQEIWHLNEDGKWEKVY